METCLNKTLKHYGHEIKFKFYFCSVTTIKSYNSIYFPEVCVDFISIEIWFYS
jgi:hypothetical protein